VTQEQQQVDEAAISVSAGFRLAELTGSKLRELVSNMPMERLDRIARGIRAEDMAEVYVNLRIELRAMLAEEIYRELDEQARAKERAAHALQARATDDLHDEE